MKRAAALVLGIVAVGAALLGWALRSERREPPMRAAVTERVQRTAPVSELEPAPVVEERREAPDASSGVPAEESAPAPSGRTFRAAPEQAFLVFRVLDPSGQPLADRKIDALFRRGTNSTSTSVQTSSSGVVRMLYGRPSPALDGAWKISVCVAEPGGGVAGKREGASAIVAGDNDLGDVPTWYPPLLVAGRVVDRDGAPIADAEVDVHPEDLSASARAEVEDDGTFAVYDDPPASEPFLLARAPAYVWSRSIPFHPGDRDVVVVLERGATIAGSVALPEGARARDVHLVLHSRTTNSTWNTYLRPEGAFLFTGLAPGTYDLECQQHRSQSLLEIPSLVVESGEVSRDSRLERIDLTNAVHDPNRVPRVRARRADD